MKIINLKNIVIGKMLIIKQLIKMLKKADFALITKTIYTVLREKLVQTGKGSQFLVKGKFFNKIWISKQLLKVIIVY